MSLTDTEIRKAKPRERAYPLSDGAGLYLSVTPSGGKLWRWGYIFKGKEKLMSFGRYPDVPLSAARERHGAARRLLASGTDPMAARKAEKASESLQAETFERVAFLWLAHWRTDKSPRHADTVRRRIEANILPSIGGRPVREIEAPELVAMVKRIEARGVSDLAKRALETVGQVFRFAIAHGYASRNPASDIKPRDVLKPTRKTNLARIDGKQLPDLLRKIEVYQGTHLTRFAIKLMALTFVRTSELIGAEWAEFDLPAARWDIPAERMKMKTPHIVPLAGQTLEILALLCEISGKSKWLFPGDRGGRKPMSNNTILQALKRMGYQGIMTGHGFRGLASTLLHEQGCAHEHIELQLAHAPRNAVSAAYNHARHLKSRAAMMQQWADFLDTARRSSSAAR